MFFKKQWELSLRTPEPTSLARATSFKDNNVGRFYDNLNDILKRCEFEAH